MIPAGRSLVRVNLSVALLGLVPLFAKVVDLDAVGIIAWRAIRAGRCCLE